MKLKFIVSFFVAVFALFFFSGIVHAALCVNLSVDLSQGSTDKTSSGQVTVLQKYLVSTGYLSATPNGVFGPATLAAVKKFQSANNISVTGSVGQITRFAINIKSCQSTTVQTTVQTPVTTTASQSSIIATTPLAGETLKLGSQYTVSWTGPINGGTYSVILEDASGTPQGFINSASYANQYLWQVGTVNNSSSASSVLVPPGTYRVHVENASIGAQSSDVTSGLFTISSSIHVNQIIPQSIPADGTTAAVIYGSGFNNTSMVDVYGYGNVPPLYVSPDGTVIVFNVPSGAYSGTHGVSVVNSYSSSDSTTESNAVNLLVTR